MEQVIVLQVARGGRRGLSPETKLSAIKELHLILVTMVVRVVMLAKVSTVTFA